MQMSYCRIYIHDDRNINEIQEIIDKYITQYFHKDNVEAAVFKNETFCSFNKDDKHHCPTETRYSVEIGDDNYDDEFDTDEFKNGIALLVIKLRTIFSYVVVSSVFEDFIIEKTGWNWTPDTPIPPARK